MGAGEGGIGHLNAPLVVVGAKSPGVGIPRQRGIQHGDGGLLPVFSQQQREDGGHGGGNGSVKEGLVLPLGELGFAVIVLTAMPHEDAGGLQRGIQRPALPRGGQAHGGGEIELLEAALHDDLIQGGGQQVNGGIQPVNEAIVAEPLAHVVIQPREGTAVGDPHLGHQIAVLTGGVPILGGEVDELKEIEEDVGIVGIGVYPLAHVLPPEEIPGGGAAIELDVLGEIGEKGLLAGLRRGLHGCEALRVLGEAVEIVIIGLPAVDLDPVQEHAVRHVVNQRLGGLLSLLVGRDVVHGGVGPRVGGGPRIGPRIGGPLLVTGAQGQRGIPHGPVRLLRGGTGGQLDLYRRRGLARGRRGLAGRSWGEQALHVPKIVGIALFFAWRGRGSFQYFIPFGHGARLLSRGVL